MKIVLVLAMVAVAVTAQYGGFNQQYHNQGLQQEEYNAHPKYQFDYAVNDPHTHDQKNQWEQRDGHYVKGEYSVVQPDGKTRIVSYEGDEFNGIHYDVKYVNSHY